MVKSVEVFEAMHVWLSRSRDCDFLVESFVWISFFLPVSCYQGKEMLGKGCSCLCNRECVLSIVGTEQPVSTSCGLHLEHHAMAN